MRLSLSCILLLGFNQMYVTYSELEGGAPKQMAFGKEGDGGGTLAKDGLESDFLAEKRGGGRAFVPGGSYKKALQSYYGWKRAGGRSFLRKRGGARHFSEKRGGGRHLSEKRGGGRAFDGEAKRGGGRSFGLDYAVKRGGGRGFDRISKRPGGRRFLPSLGNFYFYSMAKRPGGASFWMDNQDRWKRPGARFFHDFY